MGGREVSVDCGYGCAEHLPPVTVIVELACPVQVWCAGAVVRCVVEVGSRLQYCP